MSFALSGSQGFFGAGANKFIKNRYLNDRELHMNTSEATSSQQNLTVEQPTQVTRETLYQEVWREPMVRVGERYGVSSSFLARVCTNMNVPRPARGYWTKFEFGNADPQIPLPKARPEDRLVWNRSNDPDIVSRPLPKPPRNRPGLRKASASLLSKRHALVTGVRDIFIKGRKSEVGFLKPHKKLLVDIVVSEKLLDAALDTANDLFQHLEMAGHKVMLAPQDAQYRRNTVDECLVPRKDRHYSGHWAPLRSTVVFIGTVAIGLTLFEMTEEIECQYVNGEYVPLTVLAAEKRKRSIPSWSWTSKRDFATGRLCLQAYCPYVVASWQRQWREANGGKLTSQVKEIITTLTSATSEIAGLVEEGERLAKIRHQEWQEQQRRWAEEAERARLAKAFEKSRSDLMAAIDVWHEVQRIQAFFRAAEMSAQALDDAEKTMMLDRISLARTVVGECSALKALGDWRGPLEK